MTFKMEVFIIIVSFYQSLFLVYCTSDNCRFKMNFTFFFLLFSFKLAPGQKRSFTAKCSEEKKNQPKTQTETKIKREKFRTPPKCTAFTFKKGSEIYIQACWPPPPGSSNNCNNNSYNNSDLGRNFQRQKENQENKIPFCTLQESRGFTFQLKSVKNSQGK